MDVTATGQCRMSCALNVLAIQSCSGAFVRPGTSALARLAGAAAFFFLESPHEPSSDSSSPRSELSRRAYRPRRPPVRSGFPDFLESPRGCDGRRWSDRPPPLVAVEAIDDARGRREFAGLSEGGRGGTRHRIQYGGSSCSASFRSFQPDGDTSIVGLPLPALLPTLLPTLLPALAAPPPRRSASLYRLPRSPPLPGDVLSASPNDSSDV